MKTITAMLLLALTAAGAAHADGPAPERQPMRPVSECMRPDRINNWSVIDKRTVIVQNGPERYLVKLTADCPRLGIGQSLRFRPNESNRAIGLGPIGPICGEVGETVSSRDQPPCAIQSVTKIDAAQYKDMEKHAKQHGFLSNGDKP